RVVAGPQLVHLEDDHLRAGQAAAVAVLLRVAQMRIAEAIDAREPAHEASPVDGGQTASARFAWPAAAPERPGAAAVGRGAPARRDANVLAGRAVDVGSDTCGGRDAWPGGRENPRVVRFTLRSAPTLPETARPSHRDAP